MALGQHTNDLPCSIRRVGVQIAEQLAIDPRSQSFRQASREVEDAVCSPHHVGGCVDSSSPSPSVGINSAHLFAFYYDHTDTGSRTDTPSPTKDRLEANIRNSNEVEIE